MTMILINNNYTFLSYYFSITNYKSVLSNFKTYHSAKLQHGLNTSHISKIIKIINIKCERFCSSGVSNKEMHCIHGNIDVKNLKFCHLNIRGDLKGKKSEIETILEKAKPHLLGLSETNQSCKDVIKYDDTMYDLIPGFTYSKTYTRVGLLIRKGIKYKLRQDIMDKLQLPCVWVELTIKGNKITIINCYREHRQVGIPNNELTKSGGEQVIRWSHFIRFWERALTDSEETWLLGDVNLDFNLLSSTDSRHYYTRKMLDLVNQRILSRGVNQLIKSATWNSGDGKSMSVIDHIYTNSARYTSVSNYRNSGSDHNMIGVIRRGETKIMRNQYRTSRDMSKFRQEDFVYILNNFDFNPIFSQPSPETQVQMLTAALEVAANVTCPYVNYTVRKNHTKWLSPQLKELMNQRDFAYKRYKAVGDAFTFSEYRRLRNKVIHEIKKEKRDFYKNATNNLQNPEDVWAKLDELAGRNTTFSEPITIEKDGILHDDPAEIAQLFNDFYQEKVRLIIENLPAASEPKVQGPPEGTQFHFHKVSVKQIRKYISSLSSSKATGHDGISNFLVKAASPAIAPVLCRIVNNCIRTSTFPDTWKVGKISVIFKNKGEKTKLNNYRPITLLCSLSKILEKVLFTQILKYFQDEELMDPRQYGFRPGRSCVHAVLDYMNLILSGKEEPTKNKVNTLLIDLSAAFDVVGHQHLLKKLKIYGFQCSALKLVESYLSDRWVYTEMENRKSTLNRDLYGVPQGSTLGPLLYLIFVINIKSLDKNTRVCYADDVTTVVRANSKQELSEETDRAMTNLVIFFAGSGLKLNNDKTELLSHSVGGTKVKINESGDTQDSVKSARLLGIIVDDKLNFHDHIDQLLKDLDYRLWLYSKISGVANTRNRLMYSYGLLFSKFVFGIQCYAGTDPTYLDRVRVYYNRCIRATYGRNPRGLTTEQRRASLRILSFESLIKYMDLTSFRSILLTRRPENLYNLLDLNYNRESRQSDRGLIKVKVVAKTERYHRTYIFRATQHWNSLPNEYKDLSLTKKAFQGIIKRYLLGDFNGPGPPEPAHPPKAETPTHQHLDFIWTALI